MKVEELEKLIESLKEISKYTELDIEITINPSKDENIPHTPYTPYNPWQYQPLIQPLSIPITWKTFSTDRITSTSEMYYFDKETNTYKLNED